MRATEFGDSGRKMRDVHQKSVGDAVGRARVYVPSFMAHFGHFTNQSHGISWLEHMVPTDYWVMVSYSCAAGFLLAKAIEPRSWWPHTIMCRWDREHNKCRLHWISNVLSSDRRLGIGLQFIKILLILEGFVYCKGLCRSSCRFTSQ